MYLTQGLTCTVTAWLISAVGLVCPREEARRASPPVGHHLLSALFGTIPQVEDNNLQ